MQPYRIFIPQTTKRHHFFEYIPKILHLISEKIKTHEVIVYTHNYDFNTLLKNSGVFVKEFKGVHEAVIILEEIDDENLEYFREKKANIRIIK